MRRYGLALALCMVAVMSAQADIGIGPRPRPPQPAEKAVNFVVEVDPNAKEARLVMPRKTVGNRAGLDSEGDDRLGNAGGRNTVVAGAALALGLCCGGLWLVRRNRGGMRGLALLLAAGGFFAGGAMVWANAAPPRAAPPALKSLFNGKITVEVTPGGDTIRLVVPPDMAAKLAKADNVQPAKPE